MIGKRFCIGLYNNSKIVSLDVLRKQELISAFQRRQELGASIPDLFEKGLLLTRSWKFEEHQTTNKEGIKHVLN